jgi:CRP-like cAMP-binding protein
MVRRFATGPLDRQVGERHTSFNGESSMSRSANCHSAAANHLLSTLPLEEVEHLFPSLEPVTLTLGKILCEPGEHLNNVYFPTTSVVSFLYTTEDGTTAEMGLVGNDGMVGVTLILGGETTPNRAVVQIAGGAFRMRAKLLALEFERGGAFQHSLLRYTQALITQISQTAVCNRLHPVAKRLSRWLLLCHDRAESDELLMTQEFIANMLGGRRESVAVAACHLQDAGLIQYARGHIRIIDRKRLETSACECYQIVKDECERLLGTSRRPDFN